MNISTKKIIIGLTISLTAIFPFVGSAQNTYDQNLTVKIKALEENTVTKYGLLLSRMEKLIERTETRITRLDARSADTSIAKQSLETTKNFYEQARKDVATAIANLDKITNENLKTEVAKIHSNFLSAKENIKKIQINLQKTLADIKKIKLPQKNG